MSVSRTISTKLIRRGIPFGRTFDPAAGRGHGVDDDRGLYFNVFIATIENQFEFIQQKWANEPAFPPDDAASGSEDVIGVNPVNPNDPLVKDFIKQLRKQPDDATSSRLRQRRAAPASPRELRWLLARQREDLDEEQQQRLQRLLGSSTDVQHVHELLQNFHIMLKHKHAERLDGSVRIQNAARKSVIHRLSLPSRNPIISPRIQ
jgi:hypothetical protein